MALEIGSRLGPYAVTAKIGEGGMGEVWRFQPEWEDALRSYRRREVA